MTTLTTELPEQLTQELNKRDISREVVHTFVTCAIETWLALETKTDITSDFKSV